MVKKSGDSSPLPKGVTGSFSTIDFPQYIQESLERINNLSILPKKLDILSHIKIKEIESYYSRIYSKFETAKQFISQFLQKSQEQKSFDFSSKLDIMSKVKQLEQLHKLANSIIQINTLLTRQNIPALEILIPYFKLIEDTLEIIAANVKIEKIKESMESIQENMENIQGLIAILQKSDVKDNRTENSDGEDNRTENSYLGLDEIDWGSLTGSDPVRIDSPSEPEEALPITETADLSVDALRKSIQNRRGNTDPIDRLLKSTDTPQETESPNFPYFIEYYEENHQIFLTLLKDNKKDVYFIQVPPEISFTLISQDEKNIVFNLQEKEAPLNTCQYTLIQNTKIGQPWLWSQSPEQRRPNRLTFRKHTNIAEEIQNIFYYFSKRPSFEETSETANKKVPFLSIENNILHLSVNQKISNIKIPKEFSLFLQHQDDKGFILNLSNTLTNIHFTVNFTFPSHVEVITDFGNNEFGRSSGDSNIEHVLQEILKEKPIPVLREERQNRLDQKQKEAETEDAENKRRRDLKRAERFEAMTIPVSDTEKDKIILRRAEEELKENRRQKEKAAKDKIQQTRLEKVRRFSVSENPEDGQHSKKFTAQRMARLSREAKGIPTPENPFILPPLPNQIRMDRLRKVEEQIDKRAQERPFIPLRDILPLPSLQNEKEEDRSSWPSVTYDKSTNTLSIFDTSGYKKTFTFKVPVVFTQSNELSFSLDFTFEQDNLTASLDAEKNSFTLTIYNKEGEIFQSLKESDFPTRTNDKTIYSQKTEILIRMIERIELEKNAILARQKREENEIRLKQHQAKMKANIESNNIAFFQKHPRFVSPEEKRDSTDIPESTYPRNESEATAEILSPSFVQGAIFARKKREKTSQILDFSSTKYVESSIIEAGDDVSIYNPKLNLYGVFDGVGSSVDGKLAARACAEFLEQKVTQLLSKKVTPENLEQKLKNIVCEMYTHLESKNIQGSTTGTVALIYGEKVYTASVGDSQAFIYRPFNQEGSQIIELTEEDNKVSQLFKEYPAIIKKINSILDNYEGDISTLENIELPVPDNFESLYRIKNRLVHERSTRTSKSSPHILDRQIAGLETLITLFEQYQNTAIIPAEQSPHILAALFSLRSFIFGAIQANISDVNVKTKTSQFGPFDKLILETDGLTGLTRKQKERALESSTSPEEFLENQELLLNKNAKEGSVRSRDDDASSICVEKQDYYEVIGHFYLFEDYIKNIQKEIGAFDQTDFPEFFEIQDEYNQLKNEKHFVEAKKRLLQMIDYVEKYALRCGIPLPKFPTYRETNLEPIDLKQYIEQEDWKHLDENDCTFFENIIRYYTWGNLKKVDEIIYDRFPFPNIILGESFKGVLESLQVFLHNQRIQELLETQENLIQKEEERVLKQINERTLEKEEEIPEIPKEKPKAEETQIILLPIKETPLSPPRKKSWFKSTKARVAAALLALGQLINATYNEKPKETPSDSTITTSLDKNAQITRTKEAAKEVDMALAPLSASQSSALDAGFLVKIPKAPIIIPEIPDSGIPDSGIPDSSIQNSDVSKAKAPISIPDFEIPDLGLNSPDLPNPEIQIPAASSSAPTTATTEDVALQNARKALELIGETKPENQDTKILKNEVTIQRGEGVTQAILRDLKSQNIPETEAKSAILEASKGKNFPRIFKLGSLWNYTYNKDTKSISHITEGSLKEKKEQTNTPAEAKPFISSIGQFNSGDSVKYLSKTRNGYENYTIETKGVAEGSVALIGEKISATGKKIKFQFALTKEAFEAGCLPKDAIEYKAEKIAIQKLDSSKDRIIFTNIDGGILSSLFHYLVISGLTPTEAFKIANDLEKQRNIPATKKNLTYTKLPNLVHVGDSLDISHTTDEKGKKKFIIESIQKQYRETELPKEENSNLSIEDPTAPYNTIQPLEIDLLDKNP